MNDSIKATLATYGYTGSINDAYYRYLLAESGLSTSGHWHVNDLEKATLAGFGYTGSLNDMWNAFLTTSGYTGSLDDKKQAFWSDGLGFTPIAIPLTHTAVPTRGSITPSFTRATTETGQKWDEAGYLDFTALAGEIVFKGARRERNLLTFPEDFSNAAWTKINGGAGSAPTVTSGFTDPDGGTTAWRLQANAGGVTGSDYSVVRQSIASAITYGQRSIYIKSNTGVSQVVYFGAAESDDSVTVTTEWQQLAVLDSASSALFDIGCYRPGGVGSGAQSIDVLIWHPNFADITGETDQTTIRPYVSVGVESAPAYHGSMVDGVKCFDTDRSGNPISTSGSYPLVGYVPWEARTNLCLQSQTLGTTWEPDGSTSVTEDQYVAPDGTTTMDKVTSIAVTSQHYLKQGITFSAGVTTYSFYLRYVNNQWCALVMFNGGGLLAASFDLLNGVVGALGAGTTSTIQATAIADVYRVSITGTMSAGAGYLFISPNSTDTASLQNYTAAGTETVGAWGAQVELGSFATPYIPTTTVAVARNADVLTYTGGDIANIKTLAATFQRAVGVSTNGWVAALSDGTINNYMSVSVPSATQARFLGVSGAATQWDVIPAYTAGTQSKAAFSAATNDIKMDKDGTTQTQDTSATVPTVTQLNVGHVAGSFQLNGNVGGIYGWTRNLSQSELGAIDA